MAKGAAWAAPVLTAAALAPRVAASTLECTPESQNVINQMVATRTNQTYPLQINFWQLTGTVGGDGAARSIWVNLRNDGPGARTLQATPSDPIEVEITFHTWAAGGGSGERLLDQYLTTGRLDYETDWGTLSPTDQRSVSASRPLKLTWRITQPVPVRTGPTSEADLRIGIDSRGVLNRRPLIYATAKMTSFGPNDDLTAGDFTPLNTLGLGPQTAPCTDFYTTQVKANTGSNKANFTLRASGGQLLDQPWPVGSTVDSTVIGNFAGIDIGGALELGEGEGVNGIW